MEYKGRKNVYGRTGRDYERNGKERIWKTKAETKCIAEPELTMRGKANKGYGIERQKECVWKNRQRPC